MRDRVQNAYGAYAVGTGFSTPIYARTSHVGVTVVMFHASEPGAKGAKKYSRELALRIIECRDS
jgi:hypothetical protein